MKYIFTSATAVSSLAVMAAVCVLAAEKPDLSKLDLSKLPPPADKQGVTFAENVQPMLKESCVRCHGQDRPKAGLRLDSLEGALKGAKDGKVVVAGDSKASLLVIAASRIDDETAMPPKRRPGRGGRPGGPGGPGGPPPGAPGGPPPGGPDGAGGPPQGAGNAPGVHPDGPPQGGGPGGPGGFGPPQGPPPKPLTTEQVGLLRAWIDQGAK